MWVCVYDHILLHGCGPRPPENGSHASSHTSSLWDSSCLVPGPFMASALPLITTRVYNNNHGALRGPQRFGWGEGLSGTSHQRLFRPCSPGLLWQVSHLWARSSTIVCVHVPTGQRSPLRPHDAVRRVQRTLTTFSDTQDAPHHAQLYWWHQEGL